MDQYSKEDENLYYEIEYDSGPFPGVGRFVQKTQKLQPQKKDAVRERFLQMREIARNSRTYPAGGSALLYNRRMQREKAEIFYKQGIFMQDFEDSYSGQEEFSSYYPDYQTMGYGQLRTYFTWRTQIRREKAEKIARSFAFVYIYELLNNIGVEDPKQGLQRLLFFRQELGKQDSCIDTYLIRWIKDYYIYYNLPGSFRDFTIQYGLQSCYPEQMWEEEFDLYCGLSSYNIGKSAFYKGDRVGLVKQCFLAVIDRLRRTMEAHHMNLDEILFYSAKNLTVWTPFSGALFYPVKRQPDRHVAISENEWYVCRNNQWFFSKNLTTSEGKKLIGYVMKQTEAVLRRLSGYARPLTADIQTVNPVITVGMAERGFPLEKLVTEAASFAYREATKTVVRVDEAALNKIRREADETQDKLIVPEKESEDTLEKGSESAFEAALQKMPEEPIAITKEQDTDPWHALRQALTPVELEALRLTADGFSNFESFAARQGIMAEVLADAINEKAADTVGDSVLDDTFVIYEDYAEQVKEMVREK